MSRTLSFDEQRALADRAYDFEEGMRKPLPYAPTLHLFHCFCGQELTTASNRVIECPTCARQWAPAQPSMGGAS